jgi:hypothetical protein
MKLLSFKGKEMPGFSLDFNSNVILPPYIGLGKGSSIGFGVVKKISENL